MVFQCSNRNPKTLAHLASSSHLSLFFLPALPPLPSIPQSPTSQPQTTLIYFLSLQSCVLRTSTCKWSRAICSPLCEQSVCVFVWVSVYRLQVKLSNSSGCFSHYLGGGFPFNGLELTHSSQCADCQTPGIILHPPSRHFTECTITPCFFTLVWGGGSNLHNQHFSDGTILQSSNI